MTNPTALQTMTFEDEDVFFIEHDGKRLYPVPKVGEMYGYSRDESLQAFQRNKKFIEGNYFSVKLTEIKYKTSVPCLTGEGVLIYTARLGIGKIPNDRQNKVIRIVQFMAKAAIGVIEGTLQPSRNVDALSSALEEKLKLGEVLTATLHIDPALMRQVSMDLALKESNSDPKMLDGFRELVASEPTDSEPAMLTAGDIAIHFRLKSAQSANKIMVASGLQIKIGKKWVPTQLGKQYSWYRPNRIDHNSGPRYHFVLYWKPSVLGFLQEKMFGDSEQSVLIGDE